MNPQNSQILGIFNGWIMIILGICGRKKIKYSSTIVHVLLIA